MLAKPPLSDLVNWIQLERCCFFLGRQQLPHLDILVQFYEAAGEILKGLVSLRCNVPCHLKDLEFCRDCQKNFRDNLIIFDDDVETSQSGDSLLQLCQEGCKVLPSLKLAPIKLGP